MKKYYLAIAAIASVGVYSPAFAASALQINDQTEAFITGTAAFTYDSNIFLSSGNTTSGTFWDLTPGIDLPWGQSSDISGDVFGNLDCREYSSHSNLDVVLPDVGFKSDYDEGKSKFDVDASYQELAQNTPNVRLDGIIVRTDMTSASAYGESGLTEKTSVGVGVKYVDTTYNQVQFTNSKVWQVPVDAYYEFSPKTDASIGYRYSNSTLGGGAPDNHDNFFNVGMRGEFSPLITGQVRVGYDELEYSNGASGESQFGVDANFVYAASEKTSYTLDLTNAFQNSGVGVVTKDLTAELFGKTELDPQWQFVPMVSYSQETYPGVPSRVDHIFTVSAGIVYIIDVYANVSLAYGLNNDSSNISGESYTDSRVTLSLNLRY